MKSKPAIFSTAFSELGISNPLRGITPQAKELVGALLKLYSAATKSKSPVGESLEALLQIAKRSTVLASEIECHCMKGPYGRILLEGMPAVRSLQHQIKVFGDDLARYLRPLGKPGYMEKTQRTQYLVMASELVRRNAGSYYDEQLAELFQNIDGGDGSKDLSGDAIRKKREKFRKNYPDRYQSVLERVLVMSE